MMTYVLIHLFVGILTVLYVGYDRYEKKFNFFPVGMLGGWFVIGVCIVGFLCPPPILYLHAKDHWDEYQVKKMLKSNIA